MLDRPRLGLAARLNGYVTAVAVGGSAVLGLALHQGWTVFTKPSLALVVVAAMALTTEVAPISDHPVLPRVQVITTSTAFVVAALAEWGWPTAVIIGAASSLVGDLVHRRPLKKLLFNLGQFSLMYGATGLVHQALGGRHPFQTSASQVLALLVAAATGAILNVLATQLVCMLDPAIPPRPPLRRGLAIGLLLWVPELGTALVVPLVVQRAPLLAVVLLLPLLPVHSAVRAAADAQIRRAEAEEAKAEAEASRLQAEQRARLIETRDTVIRRMEEVERHKDELLASVTHELRTPASSILGVVRTLTQDPDRFSPQQYLELLGLVLEQAEQLDRLIGQLLLAARLRQPQFITDPATLELVDAATLAQRAGQLASLTYPDRPIHVQEGDGLPVRADRKLTAQILGNLIGNAAKHTPPGTPIWIDQGRLGRLAVLAVEDGGPGVPPELRTQVFERFTQLDEHQRGEAGGVGLGLWIARQLARAQGGEVLAVDPARAGGGARFELRLRLEEPLAAEAPPESPAAVEPSAGGGRGRVAGRRPTV
jgi:signal transduction histidine kinase